MGKPPGNCCSGSDYTPDVTPECDLRKEAFGADLMKAFEERNSETRKSLFRQ
jgi:hypothetical protein